MLVIKKNKLGSIIILFNFFKLPFAPSVINLHLKNRNQGITFKKCVFLEITHDVWGAW